jgi:hypothetical protein
MKTKLLYLHFTLLAVLVLDFGCKITFDFGLHHYLYFALRVIGYLSGFVLFILYLKPFKKKALYFSIYWLLPILLALSLLINGMLFALIASIFVFPFYPKTTILSDKNYELVKVTNGLLASCCDYEINKNYYFIFEKQITTVSTQDDIQIFWVDEIQKRVYFSGKYINLP